MKILLRRQLLPWGIHAAFLGALPCTWQAHSTLRWKDGGKWNLLSRSRAFPCSGCSTHSSLLAATEHPALSPWASCVCLHTISVPRLPELSPFAPLHGPQPTQSYSFCRPQISLTISNEGAGNTEPMGVMEKPANIPHKSSTAFGSDYNALVW